jgi:hypothetical protein
MPSSTSTGGTTAHSGSAGISIPVFGLGLAVLTGMFAAVSMLL